MNPIRNPQNQFFPINVILPEKQGKISNGVKKIIITFLLFFLLFGIKEEALADFNPDCTPGLTSPADGATDVSLGPIFSWPEWPHGGCPNVWSFTLKIRGPGFPFEECIGDKYGYSLSAGTLKSGDPPCKYRWKIRGWSQPNCKGEHTEWSQTRYFTTATSTGKCPAPPPVGVQPIECCKLNYDFEDVDENCSKDSVVADPDWKTCQWSTEPATTTRWSVCCFLNSLYKISDWLTWLVAPFAVLVSLAGAYTLTTSGGDPQRVNKGRDYIVWAVVGAILCFLIKAILAIIKMVV